MNYAAVRAVSMHSLNRQRANIVLSNLWDKKRVMTPVEVSLEERIFEWDGALRWRGSAPLAKGRIGVSMRSLLKSIAPAHDATGTIPDNNHIFQRLIKLYSNEGYLLWYDLSQCTANIVLKEGATSESQLKAWGHGLLVAYRLTKPYATTATSDEVLQLLDVTLIEISSGWEDCVLRMRTAGWDTQVPNLETSSRIRICPPTRDQMREKKL